MFLVCGEALFDVFVSEVTTSHTTLPLEARVGGSPFNVAVGLARLGQPVAMLTGLSTDFLGARLVSALQAEGVSTQFIARKTAPTTLGFVQQDAAGVPKYAFYGNGAADRLLSRSDLPTDLADIKVIHFGSYSIVAQTAADSYLALAHAQQGKRLLSLDPNIRLNVEPDLAIWRQRIDQYLDCVDVLKVSDEDLGLLYPNQAPEAIIENWLARGLKLAALTRGSKGASLWSAQAQVEVKAQPITVIDTVGAGDTFQACLLDAIASLIPQTQWHKALHADTLRTIGQFAVTAAAITCSRRGADLPRRAEVDAALSA